MKDIIFELYQEAISLPNKLVLKNEVNSPRPGRHHIPFNQRPLSSINVNLRNVPKHGIRNHLRCRQDDSPWRQQIGIGCSPELNTTGTTHCTSHVWILYKVSW